MKLELKAAIMTVAKVNVRSEVRGEERDPAGDLKLDGNFPAEILDQICGSDAMRRFLFYFDAARGADLADEGRKGDPNYLPHLRYSQLEYPLKWSGDEMTGAKVVVRDLAKTSTIELDPAKVNNLSIEPLEGGSVALSLRVQVHPDEKRWGKLCLLDQREVEVSIAAAGEEPSPE